MIIKATKYNGKLVAPGSKSHAQRLLLLATIAQKKCSIQHFDHSSDNLSMLTALQQFGHQIQQEDNQITIERQSTKNAPIDIQIGESGFGLRSLAFVGHCFSESFILNGKGSLLSRTHWATIQTLESLGLHVEHNEGKLPLQISGTVQHFQLTVDGSSGSQHVSGLFIMASQVKGCWQITIENLQSAPYFYWTLALLAEAGFTYQLKGNTYSFDGAQNLQLKQTRVEGDWSSVAAHLVGAAISGSIQVSGLLPNNLQADQALLKILQDFGAKVSWQNGILLVEQAKEINGFETDINDCPDLFPVLVILGCAAQDKSIIRGVNRLQNKESDRLDAMCAALDAWKIRYETNKDQITIWGEGKLPFAQLNSHNDHRIAMAICIAGLLSKDGQEIDDLQCLKKSYPHFYEDFLALSKDE